jgi:hypothetical protein
LRQDLVSGVIVLDPSTKTATSPHQSPTAPAAASVPASPAAPARCRTSSDTRRNSSADSRSSVASTASGRRFRARQYAGALTAIPARCRRCVIAVLNQSTCSSSRWTVAAGPSCRSRHLCPAATAALPIRPAGTYRSKSSLIRRIDPVTLAIRGLLLVGDFCTTILTGGHVLR